MKSKLTALMLAVLLLVQAFVPGVALAANASSNPKSVHNLVKVGELDTKSYPKLDNKTILAIQKQAREKQKRQKRTPGAGFFSTDNPYFPGQDPTDEEKAAAFGRVRVKFETVGLNDNGTLKDFQWKEIFGVDSNGNPTNAKIHFIQKDAKTNQELGRYTLNVNQAGEYKWTDALGKVALLPLYSNTLEPYKYDAVLDYQISDKVKLLAMEIGTTDEQATFTPEDGKNVADIPLKLKLAQVASTKFESEWKTSLDENSRPQVEGLFNTKNKDQDGFDIENLIAFPKNDTDSIKLRNDNVDPNNPPNLPYDQSPGLSFMNVPKVYIVEGLDFSMSEEGTPTYNFDEANKTITTLDNQHKFKYDFTYDVINGGKLTMTEIIPVTFDANGGKFASITEEGAEQKIVKEVEYGKDLTGEVEEPAKERETFKGWGIKDEASSTLTPVKDADYQSIKSAKTFYAIWSEKEIQVPEIPLYETYKEGTDYSSAPNDIGGKGDYPSRVKKEAYIDNGDGTKLTFNTSEYLIFYVPKGQTDGLDEPINPQDHRNAEKQFKQAISEEENTSSENFRTVTWRFQIVKKNADSVKPRIVKATFKVYKNIYPGLTNGDKPDYVPDEFVKVTVNPTDKAVNKQVKYYYVNPFAKVVIPEENPTGNGDNQFVKWTVKADGSTEDEKDITLVGQRNQFEKDSTITAQYTADVIPQEGMTKPDTVPDNFVEVKFVPTDKGTMEGAKIFWVNPDKAVTIPVKDPVGKTYYTFKEWKIGDVNTGETYKVGTPKQFTEKLTTITATYTEAQTVIPYDPSVPDPMVRPDGYVRVTFAADPGLKLTEQKAYYVKKNAGIELGNAELAKPTYEAQTGYKFDKWDKEDTVIIEATDILVTAKATKLESVIPEKDSEGNTNTKPDGYKEVTFVVKTGDESKGTITGVAKFYVNPKEYVKINPPETEAKTGYVFGSWDKDATIPTIYKEEVTTITGSFNGLKDVIPKTKDDESEKPKGYVTVTFEIEGQGGKIADGQTTVYYVNPAKEVTVPQPKTEAKTGYEFEKWNQDTVTTAKKYTTDTMVKGNFKKLDDIIPFISDDGKPNPKPEGYVTLTFDKGDHGKEITGQTVYYVNPKADPLKKLGDPLIKKPEIKAEPGYKFTAWDTKDTFEIKADKTVKAQYEELKDVISQEKEDGSDKPDGYITVTFVKGDHGKELKGQAVYYVNPNKAVVLKEKAPTAVPNTGYKFARWDVSIDQAIQYKDGAEITALYNDPGNISTTEVAGYVKVEFKPGTYGTLEGTTNYWIKPDVEVNVPAPTVKPNVGYQFDKWDKDLTVKLAADAQTYVITAEYKDLGNIIPQEKTDGSDKPDGYFTVTFKAVNGSLAGATVYYVKPNVDIDLTDTANAITKKADVGFTDEGGAWAPEIASKQYTENETYTFTFKALADVIEKIDENTKKPDGYVTVKVVPTDKATDKTEKTYFVNPNKEVTIPFAKPTGKNVSVDESNPKAFTWNFTKWTSDEVPFRTWIDGIKAKFANDTTITAQYEKSITDQGTVMADEITVHESFKDESGNWVNNFIDTDATETILKAALKVKGNPLPVDATVAFLDDGENAFADDAAFKAALYDKLQEKDDGNNPSRIETVKAKVSFANGETQTVGIPIKVIKNIYEAKTKEGKPVYVPDNYVKVTLNPTTKAQDSQKTYYYVNPDAKVVIPGKNPTGTGDNKFIQWTMKADGATGNGADYKLADRHQFTEASTITAQYVVDVIPQDGDTKPEGVPDNFVKVTFVPTDNGTMEGANIFWVNPEKEVTIPVKNPVGKQYFTFKEWKMGAQADGAVYNPANATKFTVPETIITATYMEAKNIIPYDPSDSDPMVRPDGYVRVTFAADPGLKLTEQKAYYVKKNAGITLGNEELVKPKYDVTTGYKFDKWDKDDTTTITNTDILVTAKATKLDTVIPETKDDGTSNEKPDGYKEVTFVVKSGDEAKGSIEGVAKFYVNPTEYVTINPPETKANTGYEFGTWDKDATRPTVYDEDTTITGSFNGLKDVIPKTKDDESEKPAGYKTVTFVINPAMGGKIVDGETKVYFVNPDKEVTIPQPKTVADTGYAFDKWDQDTTTAKKYTEDTTVKGKFKKLDDIIPSTNDDGKPNAKPDGYVTVTFDKGEHGKEITGQTAYYVNPKAEPAKTIGDITKPAVTPETGFKANGWDKVDADKITGTQDITVTAQYESIADVIPKTKDDDSEKPDGYITVTFDTTDKGGSTKKVVYVNPEKAVVLKGYAPKVNPITGYDFADWDRPIKEKVQYADGDVITAKFNEKGDVIPQEKTDGSDKPAGYLTVTFAKGDHGELSGKTVYYVKPNKEVTVPAPTVTPATGYKQKSGTDAWDKALTQTFTEDTTIMAQYAPLGDIIPQEKTDGSDKPDGYITVTFVKGDHGTNIEGQTVYYVNPKADPAKIIGDITKPTVTPETGFKANGWDKKDSEQITGTQDITVTAQYDAYEDVIPKTKEDESEKPEGYVTVKLIPTNKSTDATEKIFFVNPTKKVTIANKPEGKKEKTGEIEYTYTFTGWTVTRGTIASWANENITGKFIQDTDITAQYTTKVDIGTLIPAPVPKKDVVTPINDVPKPEDLIKNIPGSEKDPLPEGTTFKYTDDGTPEVSNPGKTTAKVEVKYPNGKTVVVEVPITVVDNVVPQTGTDKPKVPDNYVKVDFLIDPAIGGKISDGETTIYYVNPKQDVTIPQPKTIADTGYEFDKWDKDTKTPAQYTTATTVKGSFTKGKDIIPGTNDDGTENTKPDDYVTVTFDKGANGSLEGQTVYFVNPKAGKTLADVTYPTIKPETGFTANGWDKDDTTAIEGNLTVTAQYQSMNDVIPKTQDDGTENDKPEGYITVTFERGEHGTLDGKTVYYVNPNKAVKLKGYEPKVTPEKDYTFAGWDTTIEKAIQYKDGDKITAQYTKTTSEPDITAGMITTYVGTKPTIENYQEVIKGVPFETDVSKVEITTEPDVSKVGMTEAEIKITFKNGDVKTVPVPVKVLKKETRPGGSSGGGSVIPSKPEPKPEKPSEGDLNKDDHYQYLIGYPDGTFAPNRGMTRAEVATMFTRLLKDRPVKWLHYSSGLSDIYAGDWYADTVGYAVQKGIVSGYPDGTFKPNQPITRAEFASIASRFAALTEEKDLSFSDLDASHWGYKAIRLAASNGWISGYPDNTFRPEKAISRAEVTSITNRMLNRYADLDWIDAHRAEVIRFSDVGRSDWFFEPVMEATMGHDFNRDADGKTEHWTGLNGKTFI